jgi:hypothetical protein
LLGIVVAGGHHGLAVAGGLARSHIKHI